MMYLLSIGCNDTLEALRKSDKPFWTQILEYELEITFNGKQKIQQFYYVTAAVQSIGANIFAQESKQAVPFFQTRFELSLNILQRPRSRSPCGKPDCAIGACAEASFQDSDVEAFFIPRYHRAGTETGKDVGDYAIGAAPKSLQPNRYAVQSAEASHQIVYVFMEHMRLFKFSEFYFSID
jgi:hypothetical protein